MTENTLTDERLLAEKKQAFLNNLAEISLRFEKAVAKAPKAKRPVRLLAASKTVDADMLNFAAEHGITYMGENRVQELMQKLPQLSDKIEMDFIGHLQTNKVRDVVGKVQMIHSVHSVKLAKEIGKISKQRGLITDVLLEVNIANEESKSGFSVEQLWAALPEISQIEGIFVRGLMAIPPICENAEKNRPYFCKMYQLSVDIRGKKMDNISMDFLSMGMSDDFEVAIEEGANIVRIGTALFGKRNYL